MTPTLILCAALLTHPAEPNVIDLENPGGLWLHLYIEDDDGTPWLCNIAVNVTRSSQAEGQVPHVYGEAHAAVPRWVIEPPVTKDADLNGDGRVDQLDLAALLSQWGPAP